MNTSVVKLVKTVRISVKETVNRDEKIYKAVKLRSHSKVFITNNSAHLAYHTILL